MNANLLRDLRIASAFGVVPTLPAPTVHKFNLYLKAWQYCRDNNLPPEMIERKSLWAFEVVVDAVPETA